MNALDLKLDRLEKDIQAGGVWIRMSKRISSYNSKKGHRDMEMRTPDGKYFTDKVDQHTYFHRPADQSDVDYIKKWMVAGRCEAMGYLDCFFVQKNGVMEKWK